MPRTPKDKKPPELPLGIGKGGTNGNSLLRTVRDLAGLHIGKRSPVYNSLNTGSTLVNTPSPAHPSLSALAKGKKVAKAESSNTTKCVNGTRPDSGAAPQSYSGSETITFTQAQAVFALDVSGSTAGKVLRVEKSVIKAISDGQANVRKKNTQILPWDSRARRILQLDELEFADSAGGTNPTVLLTNSSCQRALSGSDLWFLLTDGEIDEDLVRSFALEIGAARLHGTACVVVVFGSSLERPIMCNISVGKSVFAVTPDCLFLFHDFESGEVYILQGKGCFRDLLPADKKTLEFTYATRWEDLPRFNYSQLHQMRIPKPRKPDQDTLILSSGNVLNLNDIYDDTLSERETQLLLSRYEDLDTLVLTAHTRGRADDARQWIMKQRLQTRSPIWMDRPDEQNLGASLTRALVEELRQVPTKMASDAPGTSNGSPTPPSNIENLRATLRSCHNRNWELFCSVLGVESKRRMDREVIIQDCVRGFEIAHESSPRSSAPCSPGSHRAPPPPSPVMPQSSPIAQSLPPSFNYPYPSNMSGSHMSSVSRSVPPSFSYHQPPNIGGSHTSSVPELLFLQGYEAFRKRKLPYDRQIPEEVYGTCGFCGESDVILCLLLKMPPQNIRTKGFPAVGIESKHKYPLVLGNYPETDVVAPLVCCDACSHFLVQHGEGPDREKLTDALPMVSLRRGTNKSSWLLALAKSFEDRFHTEILILVLLSSICSAIEDLSLSDSRETDATISMLKRALHFVSSLPATALISTPSPRYSPMVGIDPSGSLQSSLSRALDSLESDDSPLLFYPLDGFSVLVYVSSLLQIDLQDFVWLRTLFHFSEKHFELRSASGDAEATEALLSILSWDSSLRGNGETSAQAQRRLAISITNLDGTYLFPAESNELSIFQRLGDLFLKVQSRYAPAIAAFLHLLLENAPGFETAEQFFNGMKNQGAFRTIFWAPDHIDEEVSRKLIIPGHK